MSIQNNFPAIKPTLLLDFASTEQLDPRITFTRASTATYYSTQTAKAEENLLLQSQALNTSPWAVSSLTATNNTGDTTAPDGTSTATKIALNATSGVAKWVRQDQTSLSNVVVSIFLKAGTHSFVQIYAEGNSGNFCNFDLTGGTVGTAGANATGSIVALANGWYRCIVVFGATAGGRTYIAAVDSTSAAFGATTTAVSVDFYAWGAQREQRNAVTAYTPTTTQTITNYIPQLLTAASNVARFDHNPITFESLGLEIEESRTNLLLQSETCNVSPWASSSPYSVTANTAIAPDGAQTADALIVESGQSSFSNNVTRQVVSKAASAIQYTRSGYFKALGVTTSVRLQDIGNLSANSASVIVSLIDGSVVTAPSVTGAFTGASVAVSNAGNGWWRVAFTYTTDAHTSLTVRSFPYVGASALTGDGFSGLLAWGAQLEAGAFATSYIPTVASQVTRAADAASMTGTNFSSWYNQGEGTFYVSSSYTLVVGGNYRFDITDGTSSNLVRLRSAPSGTTQSRFELTSQNTIQTTLSPATTNQTFNQDAVAYKVDYSVAVVNAGTVVTDTSLAPASVNQMAIGSTRLGASVFNGHFRKIAYYPIAVTSAQLQALTS